MTYTNRKKPPLQHLPALRLPVVKLPHQLLPFVGVDVGVAEEFEPGAGTPARALAVGAVA